MKTKLLKGTPIANKLKTRLKKTVKDFGTVIIAVIYNSENNASVTYLKSIRRIAEQFGIHIDAIDSREESVSDLVMKISEWNTDEDVYGIIPLLPLLDGYKTKNILAAIDWRKDIDCATDVNIGRLSQKEYGYTPCTALSVIDLLGYYQIDLEGKHVVIIGRSNVIGRPLIQLCLQRNATVTCCHSRTKNLEQITKMGDILISAVGIPNFVKSYMVKDNAIAIDVGINYLDGKIVGDVDIDSVKGTASAVTPVPGGVGSITTYALLNAIVVSDRLRMIC